MGAKIKSIVKKKLIIESQGYYLLILKIIIIKF